MSTFIVAVTSTDGFIANEDHVRSFEWKSNADKDSFRHLTERRWHCRHGFKDVRDIPKKSDRATESFGGRLNIVYSRIRARYEGKNVETTYEKPAELIRDIIIRGIHKDFGNSRRRYCHHRRRRNISDVHRGELRSIAFT